jgi:hypothetical protein
MHLKLIAIFVLCLLVFPSCAVQGAELDQRRPEGPAYVYVNFAINCHDWLDPDMSSAAVLRVARQFAKHKLRADFYVTESLARAWAEKAPGTIPELKKLGMEFGYHHRPPHPLWYDSPECRRILALPPEEAYRELERFETFRLDLETGRVDESAKGGYAGTAELVGSKPLVLGAGATAPHVVAWDREILVRMGARAAKAWHGGGNPEYPLIWWQGLLARPSDFSVVRVPPNSKQRAANIQVLPRGVAEGEEAGNFWWDVTDDPEAQEHAPGKYLLRKVESLPAGRIAFVTCLIHEDNWYKQGTSWNGTYFEDRGRKQPRTPPYKPEPRRMVRVRSQEDQDRIWNWWDGLVEAAARDRRVRVVIARDLLGMVRADDLERTYDRATVVAAAKKIADSGEKLPEFVVTGDDALSLADCVQVFTRALAGEQALKVRTMLGPGRPAAGRAAQKLRAADVTAAAKSLAPRLNRFGRPDALPATVPVAGRELPLEMYLYASARVLAGEKSEFEAPSPRVSPDPARWAMKPARRR